MIQVLLFHNGRKNVSTYDDMKFADIGQKLINSKEGRKFKLLFFQSFEWNESCDDIFLENLPTFLITDICIVSIFVLDSGVFFRTHSPDMHFPDKANPRQARPQFFRLSLSRPHPPDTCFPDTPSFPIRLQHILCQYLIYFIPVQSLQPKLSSLTIHYYYSLLERKNDELYLP